MKSILFKSLFVIVLVFTSCKNDPKETVAEEKTNIFQVVLDVKVKDTTDLVLYYKDGTNEWIVEDKAIWNTVKGKDQFQTVTFDFKEDIVPIDFRLDIGRNEYKNQQPFELRSFIMKYYGKSFVINQDKINFFFKPNQYVVYDEKTKQYSLKKDEKGNYDPYFETAPTIYPHITKLVMNN